MNRFSWMMRPASNRSSSSAASIAENTSAVLSCAWGNARPRRKFAVVYFPGMAILSAPAATSSFAIVRFEISSGPQLRPSALPASSST